MQIESIGAATSFSRLEIMLDATENELAYINRRISSETDLLISREFSIFHEKVELGTRSVRKLADVFRKAQSCTAAHNPIEYE